MTTYNFQAVRRQVERSIPCRTCGVICKRTFVGECTLNPFNKNADGEICSREEVAAQSLASATREADQVEAAGVQCQWCSERNIREALIRFLDGEPLPTRAYGNPTFWLMDRKNVEEQYAKRHCEHCGETSWKSAGYVLTEKGRRLAENLKAKATKRGEYPFPDTERAAA